MADGSPALTAEDLRFLVEFRDYLNSAAYPASGSTIAFSTFVSDRAAGHRMADARVAYPGYNVLARQLRDFVFGLSIAAFVLTVLVALMGAYVYWGNAIVASAGSALTQRDNIATDIAREEATGVTRLYPADNQTGMRGSLFLKQIAQVTGGDLSLAAQSSEASSDFLGLCDAIARLDYGGKTIQVFRSSTQEYLCSQNTDINTQLKDFGIEVESWYAISHHFLPFQPKASRNSALLMRIAPHELSVIDGYAIPLAMGFLGSAAFILRGYIGRLGDRILTTRDLQSNLVRLVLGVLSGLAVGFFFSPSGSASPTTTDALGLGISLTAPALAFLAGYAVDVLFRFLDTIAGRAFSAK